MGSTWSSHPKNYHSKSPSASTTGRILEALQTSSSLPTPTNMLVISAACETSNPTPFYSFKMSKNIYIYLLIASITILSIKYILTRKVRREEERSPGPFGVEKGNNNAYSTSRATLEYEGERQIREGGEKCSSNPSLGFEREREEGNEVALKWEDIFQNDVKEREEERQAFGSLLSQLAASGGGQ